MDPDTKAFVADMDERWAERRIASRRGQQQRASRAAEGGEGGVVARKKAQADDYRTRKQRVHAALWVKEIEKMEEARLGGGGGGADDIDRLLDSCSECVAALVTFIFIYLNKIAILTCCCFMLSHSLLEFVLLGEDYDYWWKDCLGLSQVPTDVKNYIENARSVTFFICIYDHFELQSELSFQAVAEARVNFRCGGVYKDQIRIIQLCESSLIHCINIYYL